MKERGRFAELDMDCNPPAAFISRWKGGQRLSWRQRKSRLHCGWRERTIKAMFCLDACFMSVKEKLKESIVQPQMEMACIRGKKLKSGPFYIILEVFQSNPHPRQDFQGIPNKWCPVFAWSPQAPSAVTELKVRKLLLMMNLDPYTFCSWPALRHHGG